MDVFFDSIIFYLQKTGGISLYWYELLYRFLKDEGVKSTINYSGDLSGNVFGRMIAEGQSTPYLKNVSRYLDFPVPSKCDIVHSSYYRIPINKNKVRVITTVHDYTYEHYRSGLPKYIHSWQKDRAVKFSDGIIVISNSTKQDVLKFNPELDPKKISVINNGVSSGYHPLNDGEEITKDYVLFVGGRSGYKNFINVVPAVASFNNLKLYVVGAPLTGSEINLLDRVLPNRYKCFTDVEVPFLNRLYNSALGLVYPSLYEGFGIPVAEAMAAGCPVIAANTSSIPEVAGDSGILLDSPESENIAYAIQLLTDNVYRDKLVCSGIAQSKKFSWDRCYKETKEFYMKVISSDLI